MFDAEKDVYVLLGCSRSEVWKMGSARVKDSESRRVSGTFGGSTLEHEMERIKMEMKKKWYREIQNLGLKIKFKQNWRNIEA